MQKIIFLLLSLSAALAYGQQNLKGTVLDATTGEPIIGPSVYISKLEKGSISDISGEFILENIPEGKHNLLISSLGYGTKNVEIELPLLENLVVRLSPTAIEIEEVIISTPFHQLQSDNVMKVERTTVTELTRSGALNLAEGISSIAGVETITTGAGIGKPVIRGLSSNRVLVYSQGVRLENQQFGDEHGLGLSSSGMESVEVIKGPASLLYGSDALGGVLYLNPEKYALADSTSVDGKAIFYSNTLGAEANVGFKTSGNQWKFLVRGNYAAHSDYETGAGQRVTNSRYNETDVKTGIGFRNDSYKADLRYNLNSSELGIPEEIGEQTTSRDPQLPYQSVQNHILSLDNSYYFKNSSFNLKLGYLFNNRKEFEEEHEHEHEEEHSEEGEADSPALQMHLETLSYDLKYNFPKKGNFETIVGIQGMFQTNTNLGEEILIPDASVNDFGILGTAHYHLERADFQAGLRYDHRQIDSKAAGLEGSEEFIAPIDRRFDSYNGALGIKYDIDEQITARLNLSSGFRAPNLAELTSNGTHSGANRFEIGNPELDNEQNYQIDVSLEYRNQHLEVFTNAFFNRLNNYIYLEPTGEIREENLVFQYIQNDAKLYGGEAGFHLHPHPVDWLHFESSFDVVLGERDNGQALPLIPGASILNTFRVEFPKLRSSFADSFAFLSLKTVFDQNRTGEFETPTGGYSLLNAGMGTTLLLGGSALELQVSGTNLLNRTYISHLSRLKQDGIPNMGRNIMLSARISL
ncbi:TonB-dependent receptor [Salinimicrobium soli]|uniref:TonB-dependent receptor n=1 Tax=Salinimicrobium soli TaxID=1254399 RepID=UPI003AAF9F4B